MRSDRDLKNILDRIDHRGYPAYKDTKGAYQFGNYILDIEHVQGDPFASPSQLCIAVSGKSAGIPLKYYDEKHKRIATQDYLLRKFGYVAEYNARSANREVEFLMKKRIAEFEKNHGKITGE